MLWNTLLKFPLCRTLSKWTFTLTINLHWLLLILSKKFNKIQGQPTLGLKAASAVAGHSFPETRQREDTLLLNWRSVLKVGFLEDKPPFHTLSRSTALSSDLAPESAAARPSTGKLLWCSASQSLQELTQNQTQNPSKNAELPKLGVSQSFELRMCVWAKAASYPLGKMRKTGGCITTYLQGQG